MRTFTILLAISMCIAAALAQGAIVINPIISIETATATAAGQTTTAATGGETTTAANGGETTTPSTGDETTTASTGDEKTTTKAGETTKAADLARRDSLSR